MTKIIDLPTTISTDANTFVPVYKDGKTQKVSATALGGGGSGLDLTSTTDVPAVEGTEYLPLNKPLGTVFRVTVQRILDWILARANTWTANQTFNANINLSGTGRKITGDFSNATVSSRTVVQTNVSDGQTLVRVIPNGAGVVGGIQAGNTSDPANQSAVTLIADATRTAVVSGATGSGTLLPLAFDTGGAERLRIEANGNTAFKAGIQESVIVANTGSNYTVSLASGTIFNLTLTANCTYTFPAPAAGKQFTLLQKQDGTGSRTVTWPSTVRWAGGTAPTLTATAGRTDVVTFVSDDTYWLGFLGGLDYARA